MLEDQTTGLTASMPKKHAARIHKISIHFVHSRFPYLPPCPAISHLLEACFSHVHMVALQARSAKAYEINSRVKPYRAGGHELVVVGTAHIATTRREPAKRPRIWPNGVKARARRGAHRREVTISAPWPTSVRSERMAWTAAASAATKDGMTRTNEHAVAAACAGEERGRRERVAAEPGEGIPVPPTDLERVLGWKVRVGKPGLLAVGSVRRMLRVGTRGWRGRATRLGSGPSSRDGFLWDLGVALFAQAWDELLHDLELELGDEVRDSVRANETVNEKCSVGCAQIMGEEGGRCEVIC